MNQVHAPATAENVAGDPVPSSGDELTAAESLVEEVSIDGMCGVY
jgi:mycofactocin precursor